MSKKQSKARIGQPISITVTDHMREWIDSQIPDGGSRCEVIRRILGNVRAIEAKGITLESLLLEREPRVRKRIG
jgi:Arc/MetJ-type ribon-helix-helix transcriptional regulator